MNNLIWYSQIEQTGMGNFCKNQCLSLNKLGYFDNISIKTEKTDNDILNKMIETKLDIKESTVIQLAWPEQWYATMARHPKHFIGYIAIEGTTDVALGAYNLITSKIFYNYRLDKYPVLKKMVLDHETAHHTDTTLFKPKKRKVLKIQTNYLVEG